jgi:hypothetical protein
MNYIWNTKKFKAILRIWKGIMIAILLPVEECPKIKVSGF